MNLPISKEMLPVPPVRTLKKKIKSLIRKAHWHQRKRHQLLHLHHANEAGDMSRHDHHGLDLSHGSGFKRTSVLKLVSNPTNPTIPASTENSITIHVLDHIHKYRNQFLGINSIVSRDFNGGLQIKIENGAMDEESEANFTQYLEDLQTINIETLINDILKDIKELVPDQLLSDKITNLLIAWHVEFVNDWDKKVEDLIMTKLQELHPSREKTRIYLSLVRKLSFLLE